MPNPNTIPWIHCQDIQIPDTTLQQQFQQHWESGNYDNALNLLINNVNQLQGKSYIANIINTIASGISILENKYYQGVTIFLANLTNQYNSLINNFINKKSWFSTVQYTPYNFVVYQSNLYMCIVKPPVGTLPTDTDYWLYIGLQGDKGVPGIDVNMRYEWNSTNTYNLNDLVVYGDSIYVALQTNTNVTPGTDPTVWGIFLTAVIGKINIGVMPPSNPNFNMIWFQTQVDPLVQMTTTPLVGQFYRYNTDLNDWEEMYPNVLFRWLDLYEDYAPSVIEVNLDIQPSQWQNQQFTYSYPTLTDTSFVQIYPASGITVEQYAIYNTLSILVNDTTITISTSITTPTSDVPIIIKIQ